MNDPWWLVLIKVVVLFVVLLVWTIFNVWFERRLVGKMQHRLGPIMNGPLGLGQALADGMKLLIKEDFMPSMVDRVLFTIAPLIAGTAAFTAWAVIPFGGAVNIFGVDTYLQLADLPVGVLVLLSVTAVGIYGFVLAGWSSNSPYSLLGGLRSSAQMISYEIAMGLSLVSVFLYAGSMSTHSIVEAQRLPLQPFTWDLGLQSWYFLLLLPSFVVYVISMVGETNRAPFDLPEAESELVSGYITEYSGFRYAVYFLAEYINMATVSAIATTLFVGGYLPLWPFSWLARIMPQLNEPWLGPIWFVIKVQLFISFFVWLRGTLPRMRYDQFMKLAWKALIPISLVWIIVVATIKGLQQANLLVGPLPWVLGGIALAAILAIGFLGEKPEEIEEADVGEFDAFAGGYPVPPMPGQVLPELSGVVTSTAEADQAVVGEEQ
ncbi:MAG TPA: NADH-quinone oxidoreductase subunit NuoH [Propionicimonas sp.]|uniref:NADH-quinone oxidoreductase subunit NuoH n=1 Tax=Propionicimonas sp. TaxID=1955623 RepID=UPI002F40B698